MLEKRTNILDLVFHTSHGGGYIRCLKNVRAFGTLSAFLLLTLTILSAFPIINHQEEAKATPGTVEPATIAMVVGKENASMSIAPTSATGSFAASNNDTHSEFSVSTGNYTGYTLSIKASDNAGQLVNASYGDTLDSISSPVDATTFETGAASTYTNKWGYKPNYLNSATNLNYLPAPTTSETVLDAPSTAITRNYSIDVAARVDYTKPTGTYTNTYTLTATANPVAYAIEYYDLTNIGSTILNDSGIIWNNPTSGTAKVADYTKIATQAASTNTAATITLAPISTSTGSALATPTRHTYTFAGWCRNSTDQSIIGVNKTIVAVQNSSNKVTAYNNPSTMCNGVIPNYNTSTDDFIKAGDTNFKLDPTKDNTNIKLTAVYKPTTFATAGIAANANMQTMTAAKCSNVTPNQFTTMRDSRDSGANTYVIIKLMDGQCWMADNLNFDAYTYKNNISSSTTHIPSSGTAYTTSLNRFKGTATGSTTDQYASGAIGSVNSTNGNWDTSYSYSVPLINKSGSCKGTNLMCLYPYQYKANTYTGNYTSATVISLYGFNADTDPTTGEGTATVTYNFGPGGYKIGTYYNYCAATVGYFCWGNGTSQGSATQTKGTHLNNMDICPSNWRMPKGGNASDNDYTKLNTAISGITTDPGDATNPLSFQAMLSIPMTGDYTGGTARRQGLYGEYWSATYYGEVTSGDGNTNVFILYTSGVGLTPNYYTYRSRGFPVRCLAQ